MIFQKLVHAERLSNSPFKHFIASYYILHYQHTIF